MSKYCYHADGHLPALGEVFVFGSNSAGIHGAGAAKAALNYGAVLGKGLGAVGKTYAIPTKDQSIRTRSVLQIASSVRDFMDYAHGHPELAFLVTRIGCGLAGYCDSQIAPLFKGSPTNCNFAEGWREFLE